MGCDGPAEAHPETGEYAVKLGGWQMDRCPMALLSDDWLAEIVAIRRGEGSHVAAVRCPAPSAKTIRALDALTAFEDLHRAAELHRRDPDRHPEPRRTGRPPWEMV